MEEEGQEGKGRPSAMAAGLTSHDTLILHFCLCYFGVSGHYSAKSASYIKASWMYMGEGTCAHES